VTETLTLEEYISQILLREGYNEEGVKAREKYYILRFGGFTIKPASLLFVEKSRISV